MSSQRVNKIKLSVSFLSFEARDITHTPLIKQIRAFLVIYLYSSNLQSLDDHPNDFVLLFIP